MVVVVAMTQKIFLFRLQKIEHNYKEKAICNTNCNVFSWDYFCINRAGSLCTFWGMRFGRSCGANFPK